MKFVSSHLYYQVWVDYDGDWIEGDFFQTLEEAHEYCDNLKGSSLIAEVTKRIIERRHPKNPMVRKEEPSTPPLTPKAPRPVEVDKL